AAKRRVTRPTRPPTGGTVTRRSAAPTGAETADAPAKPASTRDPPAASPGPGGPAAAQPGPRPPPPARPATGPEQPAAGTATEGTDAERPSLLRRFTGRVGPRRPETAPADPAT